MSTVGEQREQSATRRVVLLGNPNVGKTTLFNALCGARQKTSNFPGTTQDARIGTSAGVEVIDLPGIYSLELNQSESEICREVLAGTLAPKGEAVESPDVLCVVCDATNIPRNLLLVGEATRRVLPTCVIINRVDAARKRGVHADEAKLSEKLGVPVVVVSARTGEGMDRIASAIEAARVPIDTPPGSVEGLERWADDLASHISVGDEELDDDTLTDRLDKAFTHPVVGVAIFALVMTGLFWVIFKLAEYPMGWIEWFFVVVGGLVERVLPAGVISDLIVNGVIAGVGATVVFIPQIALLFFLISLLEDTGYLARAAFVLDRVLRPFGLSGLSFVPLLSSHACALPGIMAARGVPDRRERLATMLCAPFMSCTARMPVYVLLTVLLFPGSPLMQAVAFTGCYVLGILAGVFSALLARRTILRGKSRPMALELPTYTRPSVWKALLTSLDRSVVFLKKAGTVILAISIVLWWLGAYPHVDPPAEAEQLRAQVDLAASQDARDAIEQEADAIESRHAARSSFIGRLGEAAQPVFAPLGYDRQLTVGVLASFAAREVFVSTMAVQVLGTEDIEEEGLFNALRTAKRDDGRPVFTVATSWSLLVYYVLAMQCLPTLAVTAREAGGVKWAMLQLGWMCGVAYVGAMVVYQVLRASGVS